STQPRRPPLYPWLQRMACRQSASNCPMTAGAADAASSVVSRLAFVHLAFAAVSFMPAPEEREMRGAVEVALIAPTVVLGHARAEHAKEGHPEQDEADGDDAAHAARIGRVEAAGGIDQDAAEDDGDRQGTDRGVQKTGEH